MRGRFEIVAGGAGGQTPGAPRSNSPTKTGRDAGC